MLAQWLHFFLGMAGAILTLYVARQIVIPEFRPLVDMEPLEQATRRYEERVEKIEQDLDQTRAAIQANPQSSYYLNQNLQAYESLARSERIQRNRYETRLLLNRLVSRGLGFLFFVVLGGVFALILTGDGSEKTKITLQMPALGTLPDPILALVIGATWTGFLTIIGVRGIQNQADSSLNQLAAVSRQWIDAVRNEATPGTPGGQPGRPEAAVPPDDHQARLDETVANAKKDLQAQLQRSVESVRHRI